MKYAAARQHNKFNANCERLAEEYREMLKLGHEARALTLKRRIINRYGKEALALLGVDPNAARDEQD